MPTSIEKLIEEKMREVSKILTGDEYKLGVDEYNDIYDALLSVADAARKEVLEEFNDCLCKEKWTLGVIHRKGIPCYYPPHQTT